MYIYISASNISWYQARDSAIALGGHLATISSEAEQQEIDHFMVSLTWWIGATDELTEGDWQWVTGEPWDYTHWYAGEPNNAGDEDFAALLTSVDNAWADYYNTSGSSGFILEFTFNGPWAKHIYVLDSTGDTVTTQFPTFMWDYLGSSQPQVQYEVELGVDEDWSVAEVWSSGQVTSSDTFLVYTGAPLQEQRYFVRIRLYDGTDWGPWTQRSFFVYVGTNHFYEFVLPRKNWKQARDSAIKAGGHLATISSPDERPIDSLLYLAMLTLNQLEYPGAYIGGRFMENEWRWVTGEPFVYTNWYDGQPGAWGDVLLLYNQQWYTEALDDLYLPFIIEYDTDWGIDQLAIEDSFNVNRRVINRTPRFSWGKSLDTATTSKFQIQIGNDANWSTVEVWDPGPIVSSDTQVAYGGPILSNIGRYFVRVRTADAANNWTPWRSGFFATCYPPQVDTSLILTTDTTPDLTVSTFSGSLTVWLHFEIYKDSLLTQIQDSANIQLQPFSTTWQLSSPLEVDHKYWWRCRSSLSQQSTGTVSEWSSTGQLQIISSFHPPTPPSILLSNEATLYSLQPTISWLPGTDPDVWDKLHYQMKLYKLPSYILLQDIDDIDTTTFTFSDSLSFGTHYALHVYSVDLMGFAVSDSTQFWTWTLGDVNHSHTVNIQDLNYMVNYFFSGGPSISPFFVGDINGNCSVNVQDLIYLVAYFFSGGPAPKVGCSP